jgi:site-specific DNA-methyltransferase (adenine-specific)
LVCCHSDFIFEGELLRKIIYEGDCLEIMPTLADKSVDMILCDLPYGTTACKWDTVIPFEPLWAQYKRLIKDNGAIVLTASQPFTSALVMSNPGMFRHEYIWFKNVPTGMAQGNYAPMKYHESVLVFSVNPIGVFNKEMGEREGKGKDCYNYEHYCGESNHVKMEKVKKFYGAKLVNPSSILLFNTAPNRKDKFHPTQKPVALFEYLILTYSNEGDTVLDNCAGSGTTGIAAINTGRKLIMIEKDAAYCKIIKDRIEKAYNERIFLL